jgi:hypothetical protein
MFEPFVYFPKRRRMPLLAIGGNAHTLSPVSKNVPPPAHADHLTLSFLVKWDGAG